MTCWAIAPFLPDVSVPPPGATKSLASAPKSQVLPGAKGKGKKGKGAADDEDEDEEGDEEVEERKEKGEASHNHRPFAL